MLERIVAFSFAVRNLLLLNIKNIFIQIILFISKYSAFFTSKSCMILVSKENHF